MSDTNPFEELEDMIDEDGNVVTDFDEDDVETPTEEELEEMTVLELKEKYGPFADLHLLDDEDSI